MYKHENVSNARMNVPTEWIPSVLFIRLDCFETMVCSSSPPSFLRQNYVFVYFGWRLDGNAHETTRSISSGPSEKIANLFLPDFIYKYRQTDRKENPVCGAEKKLGSCWIDFMNS